MNWVSCFYVIYHIAENLQFLSLCRIAWTGFTAFLIGRIYWGFFQRYLGTFKDGSVISLFITQI